MGGEGEGDILTVVFLRTRLGTVIFGLIRKMMASATFKGVGNYRYKDQNRLFKR